MSKKKKRIKNAARKTPVKAARAGAEFFGLVQRLTRGRWLALWVILLLAAFALQATTSMVQKSGTWDETAHLPAGYTCLKTGDYRLNAEHPPLGKMIAGLPLLFLDLDGAFETDAWREGHEWEYGWEFLFSGRNDASLAFFWGRLLMVLLSLCLGLLIFFWARKLYGNGAALLALFLFAFSPNLIAHGRLTNTDMPIAFFLLLSLFCFDRAARRLTPLSALLAGVTLGLALLAKFSGLLMLPVLAVTALVRLFDGAPIEVKFLKTITAKAWRKKLVALLILFAIMLPLAYGTVWAGYSFRFSAFSDGSDESLWFAHKVPEPAGIAKFLHDRRLLPQAYLEGFHYVRSTMTRASFLDGEHNWIPGRPPRYKSWPHYFIMTSLYKTPVPVLIFFVLSAVLAYTWSRKRWKQEVPLAAAFVIYFGVAMYGNMNIGHRHILPVIPLAFIFISKVVNYLGGRQISETILRLLLFVLLLVWYVFGTVSVYPHYLAYFNEIAGGSANGPNHLTDSNIDWGQDLILLKRHMDENNIEEVHLYYFGSADPRYYGVKCKFIMPPNLPGVRKSDWSISRGISRNDYIAVSVTNLQETYGPLRPAPWMMERLRRETPVEKIGYSIYLFRSPFELPPRREEDRHAAGANE